MEPVLVNRRYISGLYCSRYCRARICRPKTSSSSNRSWMSRNKACWRWTASKSFIRLHDLLLADPCMHICFVAVDPLLTSRRCVQMTWALTNASSCDKFGTPLAVVYICVAGTMSATDIDFSCRSIDIYPEYGAAQRRNYELGLRSMRRCRKLSCCLLQ